MASEEQKKEHAEIVAAMRGNMEAAGDFTGIDYSGISDDVIECSARCAQVIMRDKLAPYDMATMIACYMQGAINKAGETST